MRLTAPELATAYCRGDVCRGRNRARRGPGRDRDALLPRRLTRPRRRSDVHRVAQPQAPTRAPSWSSAARSRSRATPGSARSRRKIDAGLDGAARRRLARAASTSTRSSRKPRLGSSTPTPMKPMRVVVDGGNGMAGPMVGPLLEQLGLELVETTTGARRRLPRPRAQSAAAREPRVHHGARSSARTRTSGSPGTATPTAASSSTTPARSSTAIS